MAQQFEDLRAWQTARSLTNHVYELSARDGFENDWALKDQIRRAPISVMSNISEGFESRTRAQFIDSLGIAKGSAGEVRSQLYIARDQAYLNDAEFKKVSDQAEKVARQLYQLIRYLKNRDGTDRVRDVSEEYLAQQT